MMELTSEKLDRLTFPTASVGGYRKQDVDDFLRLVSRDYKKFEGQIQELQLRGKEQEEKIAQLKDFYMNRESQYLLEIKQYKEELIKVSTKDTEQVSELASTEQTSFQRAVMIAQDAAFEIEQQAEAEKTRILEEASFDRGRMIKEARMESAEILNQAKKQHKELVEEAERIKDNADRRSESVETHTQKTLKELSEKKQKEEQQAKSELSKLEYKKQQLEQEIHTNRQEELTFLESQIYEYKLLLHRLEKQNWQHLADELTQRLQKI